MEKICYEFHQHDIDTHDMRKFFGFASVNANGSVLAKSASVTAPKRFKSSEIIAQPELRLYLAPSSATKSNRRQFNV